METNKKNKPGIMEYVWFATAVLSLVIGIRKSIQFGISDSSLFFGFFVISALMLLWRRYLRKNPKL